MLKSYSLAHSYYFGCSCLFPLCMNEDFVSYIVYTCIFMVIVGDFFSTYRSICDLHRNNSS